MTDPRASAPGYPAPPTYAAPSNYTEPSNYMGPPATRRPPFDAGPVPAGLIPPPVLAWDDAPPWGRPGPRAARPARPGQAVAAAVLAFVTAALLTLVGGLLLLGAALVTSVESTIEQSDSVPLELVAAGLADLAGAGLFVLGGLLVRGRRRSGPPVLSAGVVVVAAEALYWLARFAGYATATVGVAAVLFVGLGGGALLLSWSGPVRSWLDGAPPGSVSRSAA